MERKVNDPIIELRRDILDEFRQLRREMGFQEKRLLNTRETANYLGLSPKTIANELCKGTFPLRPRYHGSKPLWDRRELDAYIDGLVPKQRDS